MRFYRNLIKMLLPYITMMLAALLIGGASYLGAQETIENSVFELNTLVAEQNAIYIDDKIIGMRELSLNISLNSNIQLLASVKDVYASFNSMYLRDAAKTLNGYIIEGGNIIATNFIILDKNATILSPITATAAEDFFNSHYSEHSTDFEEWYDEIMSSENEETYLQKRTVQYDTNVFECVPYIYRPSDYDYTAVYLLNVDEIEEAFLQGMSYDGTLAVITDSHGNEVTTLSKGTAVDPADAQTIEYVSELTGWTYTTYVPYEAIFADITTVRTLLLISLFVFFVGGAILALYINFKISAPLAEAFNLLKHGNNNKLGKVGIFNNIRMMVDVASYQSELLDMSVQQQTMIRSAFLNRLILGKIVDQSELDDFLRLMNIRDEFKKYQIICASYDITTVATHSEISNNIRAIITRTIQQSFDQDIELIICFHDIDKMIILLCYPDDTELQQVISERMEVIVGETLKDFNMPFSFSLGNTYDSLLDMPQSYLEAYQMLSVLSSGDATGNWGWAGDHNKGLSKIQYTAQFENRIVQLIRQTDADQCELLIDNLYHRHTDEKISLITYKHLSHCIQSFICQLLQDEVPIDYHGDEMERWREMITIERNMPIVELFSMFKGVVRTLCGINRQQQTKNPHSEIMARAVSIIEQEFSLPEMSLSYMAERLDISEAYFSQLFKKHHGTNFLTFLENQRLTHATKLLKNGMQIQHIATACGYTNAKSFSRAFKRAYSINPTEYS